MREKFNTIHIIKLLNKRIPFFIAFKTLFFTKTTCSQFLCLLFCKQPFQFSLSSPEQFQLSVTISTNQINCIIYKCIITRSFGIVKNNLSISSCHFPVCWLNLGDKREITLKITPEFSNTIEGSNTFLTRLKAAHKKEQKKCIEGFCLLF